ncbi:MAG: RluA family pseudouridine synthase [Geminicoccaceae bacterium]
MRRILTATAGPDDAGQRLDKFLATRLPELSRARLQDLIGAGEVSRDAAVITDGSSRVKPGQRYTVHVPEPRPAAPQSEARPLDVVFEDEHLLVLDKPAGLVVHPAPGHARGTLVNALLAHCAGSLSGIGGVLRPGIVHRLDKDVSGLLVVAKHDRAHLGLAAQFSVHRIERTYAAIVWGVPARPQGAIDRPIGRHPKDRKRMAVVETGKPASTRYRLLEAFGTLAARLDVALATGRTHQIRVHLGALGLGIIGDPVYRPRRRPQVGPALRSFLAGFERIALHAHRLGFEHPVTGEWQCFDRAPPPGFDRLCEHLRAEVARSSFVNHTVAG